MSATEADIPVETLILHVTLQKNQLNLMGLVHAMRSNGLLPQVEHPLLGSFFIEELSVDHCCNIQEILNQAYSYVLTTRHSLNDTVDLSSPCCLLNWAEPFIVNTAIISSALSHTSASSRANFILSTSLVSSLS